MAIHAFKAERGTFICHNEGGETETTHCPSSTLDEPVGGVPVRKHIVPVGETCHGWKIFYVPDPPSWRRALSRLGKFFGLSALVVALLLPAPALASSGAGQLYGTPGGRFGATEYSGDASGVTEAYSDLGSNGYLQFGPGLEGVDPWTIPSGVCVVRTLYSGFDVAGTPFRWYTRAGVKTAQVDSAGVDVTGKVTATDSLRVEGVALFQDKAVVSDSLRVNGGLYVGDAKITKIFSGSASLDFNLSSVVCQEKSISIPGVEPNDPVFVGPGKFCCDSSVDVSLFGYVSASGVVTIKMCRANLAINPAQDTFQVVVFKLN